MEQIVLDRPTKSSKKLVFNTRYSFAREMLDRLSLTADDYLLDPSAGTGGGVAPLFSGRYPTPRMTVLVDVDPRCCDVLRTRWQGYEKMPVMVACGDFLDSRGDYPPTAIVMVPPFGMQQDIAHIQHAYQILQPGGRMVAVCSTSALAEVSFRLFLGLVGAEIEAVPEGSFDDPSVDGFLVHIVK
jgi:16S rRNA G1207 methylase RsmC